MPHGEGTFTRGAIRTDIRTDRISANAGPRVKNAKRAVVRFLAPIQDVRE